MLQEYDHHAEDHDMHPTCFPGHVTGGNAITQTWGAAPSVTLDITVGDLTVVFISTSRVAVSGQSETFTVAMGAHLLLKVRGWKM